LAEFGRRARSNAVRNGAVHATSRTGGDLADEELVAVDHQTRVRTQVAVPR
jgi:hypothetical protein